MKRLLPLLLLAQAVSAQPLTTRAERSGYRTTGRYAEVEKLGKEFVARYPGLVRLQQFGTTPEGRPMWAIIATRSQVKPGEVPVVLMQGGIHAGEIDGKDAGFWALRELLADEKALHKVIFVFVPVFNIDGHERVGRYNRPNQVGPEEMGWRTTSQNLNLNRDYTKADAPEMQAMLKLLQQWDPILYVDLHVTDGSQFQPDIANLIEPIFVGAPRLQPLGRKLQTDINQHLKQNGSMPLDFYPSLRDHRDPQSGFSHHGYTPRFSTGYWALHNRLSMLVETHSWKDYKTRVRSTYRTIRGLIDLAESDGANWQAEARRADQEASALAGTLQPLTYKTTDRHHTIEFPGYAYVRERSQVSDGIVVRYDPSKPQTWKIPLYDEVVADVQETAPKNGYWVPASAAGWMAERLEQHGVRFQRQQPLAEQPMEVFRPDQVKLGGGTSEGRTQLRLTGSWKVEMQPVAEGSLFVPIAQPKARLVMALLEPRSPDSYLSWGFFNGHFEQKEYMEEYVAEEVALAMKRERPEVWAEFQKRLASDPEFARSPEARLDFFYRRHPSWDSRFQLYPVFRT